MPTSSSSPQASSLQAAWLAMRIDAVGRGHEHRVGHAVEHVGQVVLGDGGLAQLLPHALERRLQFAELVAPSDFERPRVVALRDAIRALDERGDGLVHAPTRPPGEHESDQQRDGAEHAAAISSALRTWPRSMESKRVRAAAVSGDASSERTSISISPTVCGVSMPGRVWTLARMGVMALRVMAPATSPLRRQAYSSAPDRSRTTHAEQRAVVA